MLRYLFLFLITLSLFQTQANNLEPKTNYRVIRDQIQLNNPENPALLLAGLQTQYAISGNFQLLYTRESDQTWHYTFRQVFNENEIYATLLKINLTKKGKLGSLYIKSSSTQRWSPIMIDPNKDLSVFIPGEIFSQKPMIYPLDNNGIAGYYVKYKTKNDVIGSFIDENGAILESKSLKTHFMPKDTTVQVKVFNPDPLTSAGVGYGGAYSDNNDADSPELNNERVTRQVMADYSNSSFKLKNKYVEMVDVIDQVTGVPEPTTAIFDYPRSDPFFEYTNCFYHMTMMSERVVSLGYPNALNYPVYVDANGTTDDNSYYYRSPVVNNEDPFIEMGTGGVDDAEDADVVIHEFFHAISDKQSPETNDGFERQALDEGLADYFAGSYSRAINDFNWEKVYTWDGNGTWNGRTLTYAGKYSYCDVLASTIHVNGQIMSTLLMKAWEELGRDITDKIVLQMALTLFPDMTFEDAAIEILFAEQVISQGSNKDYLVEEMEEACLFQQFPDRIVSSGVIFELDNLYPRVTVSPFTSSINVKLYNLSGQLVGYENNITNNTYVVPGKWFTSSGLYVVLVERPGESPLAKKIVFLAR